MLARRLVSAAVIISLTLLVFYFDFQLGEETSLGRPGLLMCLLGLVTVFLAAGELSAFFENAASRINGTVLSIAAFAMVAVTCTPALWQNYPTDCPLGRFGFGLSGIVVGFVIVFLSEIRTFDSATANGDTIDRLGRYTFALFYLNMLFAFMLPHRYLEGSNSLGMLAIITMITTVKVSDASAYFTGKAFGTTKLAPRLSPGKTVRGSLGGLIGGCLGTAFCIYVIAPWLFGLTIDKSLFWVLVYGLLVTLAGMLGDLAESMLKRDSGTKDSSTWLPGLGGVLDVIDSLIFAAPVSFLLWI